MKRLLLALALLFCYAGFTYGATWYVSSNGNNSNTGDQSNPFQTVAHAISVASTDDTIHILDMIYENQIKINKSLTIQGTNPMQSVVMGGTTSPIVLMNQSTPPTLISNNRIFTIDVTGIHVKFQNLTIKYGMEAAQGGGIFNNKTSSSVEVIGCNFIENYAGQQGGAISTNKELVIQNSSFIGNESGTHAGAVNSNPGALAFTVENSLFYNNSTNGTGTGGAIRTNSQDVSILNNTIVDNYTVAANKIEGINFYGSSGTIELHNNILLNNKGGRNERGDGEDLNLGDLSVISVNATSNIVAYIHSTASRVPFEGNGNLILKNEVSEEKVKFGEIQQAENGLYILPIYPTSIADGSGNLTNGTSSDALGTVKSNADIGHLSVDAISLPPIFITDAFQNYPENKETLQLETLATEENISYSITGGADQNAFTVSTSGNLSFKTQPLLGVANDANQDNTYEVELTVSDRSLSSSKLFQLSIVGAKLNVVMIVLDDLNDYIGFMGGHLQTKTPNLDKLASEGVSFMNAHSNAPLCDPSRASFMNGVLPMTSQHFGTGYQNWRNNPILSETKMISEYFMANGYTTYKTGKITHSTNGEDKWWDVVHELSQDYGPVAYNGKGAAVHQNSAHQMHDAGGALDGVYGRLSSIPKARIAFDANNTTGPRYYEGWYSTTKNQPFRYVNEEDRDLMPDEENVAWTINNIQNLEAQNSDDPFFMAVGIIRPHSPFVVPDKYFDMFPLEDIQLPEIFLDDRDDFTYNRTSRGHEIVDVLEHSHIDKNEGIKRYLQGYLASVAFADEMIGRVVDAVENSQYADNTVIMLFSDHGYNMGEKDYSHKNNLWTHGTRVPLIIKSPLHQNTKGQKVEHPVSLVDIYPTLQDLCYLTGDTKFSEAGADLDGHSLKPFLSNVNSTEYAGDEVALSTIGNWFYKTKDQQNYGIKSKRFTFNDYHNNQDELYDRLYDQDEFINVIDHPAYAEVRAAFQAKLDNIRRPATIVADELDTFDLVFDRSDNWQTFTQNWGNHYSQDHSLIHRSASGDAYVTYQVENPGDINVEVWGNASGQAIQDFGTLKIYSSTDNQNWVELTTNEFIGNYTWGNNIATYQNATIFPMGTQYVKVAIEGDGLDFSDAVLGKVYIYAPKTTNSTLNLDAIPVDVDPSIFNIDPSRMRTSGAILPVFADDFSSAKTFEKSSNSYLTNDAGNGFNGDGQRLVRNEVGGVVSDAYLTYEVSELHNFRIEVTEHHSAQNVVNSDTVLVDGDIEIYTSTDNITFQKVSTRSVSLRVDDLIDGNGNPELYRHAHQFAIVANQALDLSAKYLKVVVKGDNAWSIQLNGVYFYGDMGGSFTPKQEQEISIQTIEDKWSDAADFDIIASTTSGLPLNYSITGPATLDGTTVSLTGEEGEVTITANQEGNNSFNPASKTISFQVNQANVDAEVALNISTLTLNVGEEYQLVTYITPVSLSEANLTWSSDNPAAVSVDQNGVITAVGGGIATITVTLDEYASSASALITSMSNGNVGKPVITDVDVSSTSATVSFIGGSNSTYQKVQYRMVGKGWINFEDQINDGIDQVTFSDLLPNTSYVVRMRAFNSTSASAWTSAYAFNTSSSSARLNSSLEHKKNITIYPNPTSGNNITIDLGTTASSISIDIYNSLGQLEKTISSQDTSSIQVDINGLSKGIYFIKINKDGEGFSEKLIIE